MVWLSEEQAATALGVSSATIRRRVGNGSLGSKLQGSQLLVEVDVDAPAKAPDRVRFAAPPVPCGIVPVKPQLPCSQELAPAEVSEPQADVARLAGAASQVLPPAVSTEPWTPTPIPQRPRSSAGRLPAWTGLLVWGVLTLLLFTGAAMTWWGQQNRINLQAAQAEYQDSLLQARQSQAEHDRQIAVLTQASNDRVTALMSDLTAARAHAESFAGELIEKTRLVGDLAGRLDQVAAELQVLRSDRDRMAADLALAQAANTLLVSKASLADAVRHFAGKFDDWRVANTPPPAPAPLTVALPVDGPRDRRLPRSGSAWRLEEASVTLRPIVSD